MLVLGRREGESILINGNIRVTVVRLCNGGVRIGVEAPPALSIVREEIAHKEGGYNGKPSGSVHDLSVGSLVGF
jgi:carbon storage regulator